MAKNMARLDSGIVTNVEWWSDATEDTDALVSVGDRPVAVGDTYADGKYYRNGEEVLTPLEEAQKELAEYQEALEMIFAGVTE